MLTNYYYYIMDRQGFASTIKVISFLAMRIAFHGRVALF